MNDVIKRAPALRLSVAAAQLAYAPGPDADGVYRRPPDMDERIFVAPSALVDGRWQPREIYDQAALDELTASVREHGVLEDLIALVNEQGELELITGHRRKRAALAAGGRDVPVKVVEVTLPQATEIAIISNDQRSDLTDVERGKAYERMIQELGISEAELAKRLGRPRAYISQRRQIAGAAPEVQAALVAGEISFSQARGIAQGSAGDRSAQLATLKQARAEQKAGRTLSGEAAQRHAERLIREQAAAALAKLGWRRAEWWNQGTGATRVWIYAAGVRPAEWSSAEILAAVREGRRPSGAAQPAPLAGDDRERLEARGWEVDANRAAPWLLARRLDMIVAGDATDLVAHVAAARADIEALTQRFAAERWSLRRGRSAWLAAPPAPEQTGKKQPKAPAPVACHSWNELEQLINKIEKRTWKPVEPSDRSGYRCKSCGARCAAWSEVEYLEGDYRCLSCAATIRQRHAAEQAEIARLVDAHFGAWLDAAPPTAAALILRDASGRTDDAAPAGQRLRNLLSVIAWRYRVDTPLPPVAGATAVAPSADAPDDPAGAMRRHLQEAREFAGMGIAHWHLGQARAAYDQVVARVHDPATLEALAREIDQVASVIAAAEAAQSDASPGAPPLITSDAAQAAASDLHERVSTAAASGAPVPFGDVGAWMGQIELRWGAHPPVEIDERTLERIAEILDSLADDETIPDEDYEQAQRRLDDLADRIGKV